MTKLTDLARRVADGEYSTSLKYDLMEALPSSTGAWWSALEGSLDAAKRLHEEMLPGWLPDICNLGQEVTAPEGVDTWGAHLSHSEFEVASAWSTCPARAWLSAILLAMDEERGG